MIWQALAPLAPVITVERMEMARGPRVVGTEVRGKRGRVEKRVRFEPSARIIPDAWFTVFAEGVRFLSREAEEWVKSQLLGCTSRDVGYGEGGREANEETRTKASGET